MLLELWMLISKGENFIDKERVVQTLILIRNQKQLNKESFISKASSYFY